MNESEREAIKKELVNRKEFIRRMEDSVSGKLEREMGGVIASLNHRATPTFPTVNIALEWKRQHQAEADGGEEVKPWDCDKCMWLEAIYYAAAKKANALPLDPEAP
jgi:hypothetical protein